MSEVRLLVREANGDWTGTVHGSVADVAVAALSADPVTMTELEAAMRRFAKTSPDSRLLSNLSPGSFDEPYDAGLVVIDLVARLIVVDSTYSSPNATGVVGYHNGRVGTRNWLRYHLSDDWNFVKDMENWKGAADARRREREAATPCDSRDVFFGRPLLEFVAREIHAAHQRRDSLVPVARARVMDKLEQYPDQEEAARERTRLDQLSDDELLVTSWPRLQVYDAPLHDIIREIHAAWLLTPRPDLGGLCPREVAMRQHDHISWDVQHRCEQWTILGECPPGLEQSSHAYQFGGFGTHELVVYYDLVRELLQSSWTQLSQLTKTSGTTGRSVTPSVEEFVVAEVSRLSLIREEWLDTPGPEFHLRTPRSIIHRERARIPESLSPHEAMVDPDCPCCQMLADMPGPAFWGLDGADMDEEFAFDISCKTREEWEATQREWEEQYRRWDAEEEERERLGIPKFAASATLEPSVWSASFSVDDTPDVPLGVRAFGIGCHLAEVITDLRRADVEETTTSEVQRNIDQLNRDFGNLREVLQNASDAVSETLLDPVIDHFADTLAGVARKHPELAAKCEALTSQLSHFLEQPPEEESDYHGVPY